MNTELIIAIITTIASLIGGNLYGAYREREKIKAEAQNIEADFNDKVQSIYTKFVKDFEEKYQTLHRENKELLQKCRELLEENELLKTELKKLTAKIEKINQTMSHQ